MTSSRSAVRSNRSTRSPGVRSTIKEGARQAAKAVFAAADVFVGDWPGPRLLIYHQVGAGSGLQMDVAPGVFRGHVDWLHRHGRIVGLDEALDGAGRSDSHQMFVLTFDDGYADFYDNAFPLLEERAIPFTLYLSTGHIETGEPLHPGDVPLTWSQIGEMVGSGLVTVGAHTHNHPDLRGMSVGEVEEEIGMSNHLIERHTGQVPRHFAYPKGYWDRGAETVVRRYYETATLGAGRPIRDFTDRHRLHRVPVQKSDGHFFFTRKVVSGMRLEERVRSLIRGYQHPPV